jgi:2,5-diketo-D-gluconate reductase A
MPQLGLGTWPLSDTEAQQAVTTALELGYRLIDTASAYGNEHDVGRAVLGSGLPRDEIFVTTKLGGRDHGRDQTLRAFDASRAALGLDYVDLFLIHWPVPSQDMFVETWQAMESLLAQAGVRAIGVSNFKPAHLDRLAKECETVPAVNQIQLNPRTSQSVLRAYDEASGIRTQSWSPLGAGSTLLSDPVVTGLAAKYSKAPGQIVLGWHLELGLAVVPKSARRERIAANIDIFDFQLDPADVQALTDLDTGAELPVDSDTVQPGLRNPR